MHNWNARKRRDNKAKEIFERVIDKIFQNFWQIPNHRSTDPGSSAVSKIKTIPKLIPFKLHKTNKEKNAYDSYGNG